MIGPAAIWESGARGNRLTKAEREENLSSCDEKIIKEKRGAGNQKVVGSILPQVPELGIINVKPLVALVFVQDYFASSLQPIRISKKK